MATESQLKLKAHVNLEAGVHATDTSNVPKVLRFLTLSGRKNPFAFALKKKSLLFFGDGANCLRTMLRCSRLKVDKRWRTRVRLELSKLLELQELDLEMQRVADRLSSIPAEREEIESKFKEYAAEFLALKDEYEQTLANRKQLEIQLVETQTTHDKYKQDLMKVRNEKEYVTALREIDATKKLIGTLESEILKSLESVEKLEADLSVFTPDIERKRAEVDHDLTGLDSEREQASLRLASIQERRENIARSVPERILAMYERVARIRRGQALSEVRNSTCTECRMRVRPKVYSDVRKGDQLITCDNCARILFYRPGTSESAEVALGQQ
jgi:predicted  nucleic acid-binding Zn-ribbon protein